MALQLRRAPGVEVRVVPREHLMSLIEEHCSLTVDVRDRRGDVVPMPEVILVSLEALPGDVYADGNDEPGENEVMSCRGIHVGSSVALTYEKASQFVASVVPPPHVGVEKLPFLDAMNFYDICQKNCLVWVRASCATPAESSMVKLLQSNYMSFKTGYFCLDEQPRLAERFPSVNTEAPTLVAIVGGRDDALYHFPSLNNKTFLSVGAADIHHTLADIMDGSSPEPAMGPTLASLLPPAVFPLESKQRWYLMLMNFHNLVAPTFLNLLPFFLMYLFHTKYLNRKKEAAEKKPKDGTAGGQAKGEPVPRPRKAPRAADIPQPLLPNQVRPYTAEELTAAKEGRGFLILIDDLRGLNAGTLKLPPIALDDRFTVRVLDHKAGAEWKAWLAANQPEATADTATAGSAPSEEAGLRLVAVRRQRMKLALKLPTQSLDDFLRDLLDGTVMTQGDLPDFASH